MNQGISNSLLCFIPELILIASIALIPFAELFLKRFKSRFFYVSLSALAISFAVSLTEIYINPCRIFGLMSVLDPLAILGKLTCILAAIVFISAMLNSKEISNNRNFLAILFILLITTGCIIASSSANLILLMFSFALTDLGMIFLYGLNSSESGKGKSKIAVLYISTWSLMLLGTAVIYGLTGKTDYYSISEYLSIHPLNVTTLLIGVLMILSGFLFRILLAPFGIFFNKISESSSLIFYGMTAGPVLITGLICLSRFFIISFQNTNTTESSALFFQQIRGFNWHGITFIISIFTTILASISVLRSNSFRKLFINLLILQSALILLGFSSALKSGFNSSISILILYTLLSTGIYYVLFILERNFCSGKIIDAEGIGKSNRLFFGIILILILTLGGMPLTAGFTSRFHLFGSILNAGNLWLLPILICSAAIIFYKSFGIFSILYLKNGTEMKETVNLSLGVKLILLIIILPAILFGLYYTPLIELAEYFSKIYGVM